MEFEALGRIASTVGKMRGKPSEKPANQGNPTFLFRIVKFADLTGVKSDRLLAGFAARRTFAKISCALGLRPQAERRRIGRGPRLQDFRHSFATGRLVEWYRAGLDIKQELPKLATYLGHVDVGLTYWYIEAVPELLQLASDYPCVQLPGGEP